MDPSFLKISFEKVKNILEVFKKELAFRYQQINLFFKKSVWPVVKLVITLCLCFAFIAVIVLLVKNGIDKPLTEQYQNLFGTLTQTVGTIVAIFFSLILIPLNQISTRYSPSFLKYLKKDKIFAFVFLFSCSSLIYDVTFLFIGSSQNLAVIGVIFFIQLIVLLGFLLVHIIYLSNPYNSILLPAHEEIVKNFRKWIPISYKVCKKSNEKLLKQAGIGESLDICLFKIDDRITDYIQSNLLPIREVAIKAIKDLDLEQAKNAIQTMMSIVVNYLYARKAYHSDDDPLLYFLYTEYKLIAQTGSNELKVRLHPFIVECWQRIGLQAAMVNVKGLQRIGNNFNSLVTYPVEGLKDLCVLNLLEMDSYAPGKACEALAAIGTKLMAEGYDHEASSIVERLERISLVAEENKIRNVAGSANYGIMCIYANGLSLRNAGSADTLNFPYRKINKSVNRLLESFLQTPRTVNDNMILSSFIGWSVDPIRGVNFIKVAEYGIFSPDLSEFSLDMNLECLRANMKTLRKCLELLAVHEDDYFSTQVIENIYRILLCILSYLNQPMAEDHVLFYKKHPSINRNLKEKSQTVFLDGLSILCDSIKNRADRYIHEKNHSDVLFSLYLILLYEYKLRPNDSLKELFESFHKLICNLLAQYGALPETDANDNVYKYFRLLIAVLRKNNFNDLADCFNIPPFQHSLGGMSIYHESEYPKTIFDGQWIIKRPIFQVNTYYYNKVENALQLSTLKFY